MSTADIGVVGLAVMGSNLARNFARHGFTVAVYNRTHAKTTELIEAHGDEGDFVPSEALEDFVASLKRPRKAMIMVQAGNATDAVIDQLAALMEPGDMIIDGGNAHFENTRRREAALREKGLHFVGTGVSGGEEGALLGPAIMPGGSEESYESLGPILEAISAKAPDGTPCCSRLGPDGAGHFVKMVHNGIEYSDMQLIGEAYDLLRRGVGIEPADLAKTFSEWNAGELDSYLIEVTAEVLGHVDAATGKPLVDVIVDQAGQKGTGRWTVQIALDLGVPVTGIAEATFARALSSGTKQREGAVDVLTGPTAKVDFPADFVEDVRQALYASKIVAYAQGFDQIAAASAEYDWGIDLGSCSALWRAGCIIRARFLDRITEAWRSNPELPTLLAAPEFTKIVTDAQDAWRRVVSTAALAGIPTPGFSSALAYYDGLRSRRLPAALIQGQRDFFGAHTYKRVDREGTFHTDWSGDRSEIQL
ncbi:NADP-dependent phosphogluconate dehydrogenase [Glycomyces algeriensis]|uniref:6-phosphogluconate dehydrogenase, decarboxylating n=1 Tax=Glycomyces algeriensis TaxID=256037 RepID=A0A9W6G6F5_9ACTN|nr:NADP-dependent phosphogluconate dehydrogenase [Glycomyces algeriensis]MDA1367105.1 NADP-dependent phosphogluconate dehydrogenase [Glycomyces algeriensis]MDR7348508.1 6-phosphogluconate dehydrogenase [Glycomyces algeriensis]GLI41212.1 6-phosphogluconate dehydrogenase, decarboxylating [Glycomyces algeriensis]